MAWFWRQAGNTDRRKCSANWIDLGLRITAVACVIPRRAGTDAAVATNVSEDGVDPDGRLYVWRSGLVDRDHEVTGTEGADGAGQKLVARIAEVVELVLEPLLGGFGTLEIRIGDQGQNVPAQDNDLYPRIGRRVSVKTADIRPAPHVLRAPRQRKIAMRIDEYPIAGALFGHGADRDKRCRVGAVRRKGFGWICACRWCA